MLALRSGEPHRVGAAMVEFLADLKRRKLVQWALAYLAGAWVVLQALGLAAESYDWPHHVMQVAFAVIALGFVVTLLLAWYHGEQGRQRVSGTELLLIALVLAVGGGLLWRFGGSVSPTHALDAAPRKAGTTAPGSVTGAASSAPGTMDVAGLAASAPIPAKSVAVLPFLNESGEKDQQFFSDGLSEDLITALSQFAGLKVISRDSAFQFRQSVDSSKVIGEKLGVAHLLEGSVRQQGGEVRISAQLVNAADGSVLWSQHYDRPYKDLFKLQDAITQSVANALKAKLLAVPGAVAQSDRPPSGNLEAYAAFLQARSAASQENGAGLQAAIEALDKAIQLDSRYAWAYAMLGDLWTGRYRLSSTAAAERQAAVNARAAIHMALELNPDLAIAHANYSYMLSSIDLDWDAALVECRKALQLSPNDPEVKGCLADAFATHGQLEKAIELAREVLKADPRGSIAWHWLGHYLFAVGRLDEAEQATRRQMELAPDGNNSYQQLAVIEVLRGNAASAMRWARQETSPAWRRFAVALVAQIGPDRAAADAALKGLIAHGGADTMAYQIAEVYALRKDPDATFKWLDRAWANRDSGLGTLLYTPFFSQYRRDPRFAAFCTKIGLPVPADASGKP
ncbi:MAG TPA: tetratricopeptide repeat protein [Rhodanobacteraceae bacterium]|nr:tetratricopeptide repeat protein [Rhodanobacteraceae bacterium]